MPLQQVKIMFTPEAALKIKLAIKGSNVEPLDSENQRVFDDVFEHGVDGEYYTVELNSGKGFSYPNRNIERIRSAWQEEEELDECEPLRDETAGQYNERLDIEAELEAADEAYIDGLGLDEDDANELREEFAAINADSDL